MTHLDHFWNQILEVLCHLYWSPARGESRVALSRLWIPEVAGSCCAWNSQFDRLRILNIAMEAMAHFEPFCSMCYPLNILNFLSKQKKIPEGGLHDLHGIARTELRKAPAIPNTAWRHFWRISKSLAFQVVKVWIGCLSWPKSANERRNKCPEFWWRFLDIPWIEEVWYRANKCKQLPRLFWVIQIWKCHENAEKHSYSPAKSEWSVTSHSQNMFVRKLTLLYTWMKNVIINRRIQGTWLINLKKTCILGTSHTQLPTV